MKSQMCQYRGTWQKPGFTSINGAVVIISTDSGKVVDVEVMSRYCNACVMHEKLKVTDPAKYEQYKLSNECGINHMKNRLSLLSCCKNGAKLAVFLISPQNSLICSQANATITLVCSYLQNYKCYGDEIWQRCPSYRYFVKK